MRGAGVILFALGCCAAIRGAEEPEWKARLTRLPPGSFPVPAPCELVYHLSWSDILKAGETKIYFSSRGQDGRTPGEIYARAHMRSSGLARALWPYDAKTETWVDRDTLQPIRVSQEEEDRQERNLYRTEFTPVNVVNEWITVEKRKESTPVVHKRTYSQTSPPIQDLMSAMLFLRSLSFDQLNQPISLVCYPFRDPYLVTVKFRGKENHEMLGRKVPALKFEVTLSKIESDLSLKVYDEKMKSAYFWISDDEQRIPLGLKAEIFIGSVLVKLADYRDLREPRVAPAASAVLRSMAGAAEKERDHRRLTRKRPPFQR